MLPKVLGGGALDALRQLTNLRAFPPFIEVPVSLGEHLSPRAVLEKTVMQALGVADPDLAKRFLADSGMTWSETPPRLAAPNGGAVYRFEPAPEFWSSVVNFLKREASGAPPNLAPPLAERVTQALTVVKKIFPTVTVWDAWHKHRKFWQERFEVDDDEIIASVYKHQWEPLWEATVTHFARLGLSSDLIRVEHCAWSDELGESVNIRFNDDGFRIDAEEERADYLMRFREQFLWMLRELGSRPAINSMWMSEASAFAGDPAYLYEPEAPFAEDFHRIPWEEFAAAETAWLATQRAAVRAALTPGQIAGALKELGVTRVEPLGQDRLFVQFVELGQPGGEAICKKLERQITERLKRQTK
jgi:hypothetical protein